MAKPMPKVESNDEDGINGIVQLMSAANTLFGSGKTTTSSTSNPDAGAIASGDALMQQILGSVSGGNLDAMTNNIIERARQAFGIQFGTASNATGVRAYSDTVRKQLSDEAMSRAVGEAASARLNAINQANEAASRIASAKIQSSRTTVQTQKTSASPTGKLLALAGPAAFVYKHLGGTAGVKEAGSNLSKLLNPKQEEDFDTNGFNPDDFDNLDVGGFNSPVDNSGFVDAGAERASAFNSQDFVAQDNQDAVLQDILDSTSTPAVDLSTAIADAGGTTSDASPSNAGTIGVTAAGAGGNITPDQVTTGGFQMPPAQTVNPDTGLGNSMPPAQPEAIDTIPADTGETTFVGGGEGSELADSGDFADSSTVSTDAGASGVSNLSYVGAGVRAASGDPRGAAGQAAGSLLGSYFGPVGTAVGGYIGGELGDPLLDQDEYYYDKLDNTGSLYGAFEPFGMITSDNFTEEDKANAISEPVMNFFDTGTIKESNINVPNEFDDPDPLGLSDSVICTEAKKQGLLDPELVKREFHELVVNQKVSILTVLGYRFLAAPVVLKMQQDKVFAQKWANYAQRYCQHVIGEKKSFFGFFVDKILRKGCFLVGLTLGAKEWLIQMKSKLSAQLV